MSGAEIIGLVATCDVADVQPDAATEYRFDVAEYAQVATGDWVLLRDGLGWTVGFVGAEGPPDLDHVLVTVGQVVLPDEDEPGDEPHPWEWLAQLADHRGLTVDAEHLKRVPYRIYLAESVIELCA